ncbi:MAG: ATP-binding protein [Chloroflexi bacterium]|nr:ATP-binding protein [Chloroflexota bacterium]MCI0575347.1 ATP-binding protein [Chloroflexota bacterium]MCI0645821.1 ATP-binding protein [Chloroflexota bacterium]MCI0730967.1 ATP-binding protein [Chloroflexota bacterium]
MNDEERWQRSNELFLAAALHWLRLRLEQQVNLLAGEAPGKELEALPGRGRRQRKLPGIGAARATTPDHSGNGLGEAVAAMAVAEAVEPPPALVILSRRFGLSRFEQQVLLLCVAMELDTRMATLCARAQDDPHRPYPTFALALVLFDDPAWEALSPERPLRYWRLIEINQPGGQPLIASPLQADERIVNYVRGLNYLDDRLTPLLAPFDLPAGEVELPPSQQQAVTMMTQILQQAPTNGPPPVIQLVGQDSLSKQLVAQRAAAALNLHLSRLPVELLPAQAAELETLVRLWERENFLLPVALYLDAHEVDGLAQPEGNSSATLSPLRRFLARSQGIFFFSARAIHVLPGPVPAVVEIDKPTPAEQQMAWAKALANGETDSPALLAGQFNLNVATIGHIVNALAAGPATIQPGNGRVSHDRLWQACLVHTGPQTSLLAQRLSPKATWDDIVLPEESEALLRQIAHQVAQRTTVYDTWGFRRKLSRGLGINALFAGDSGTGKTMAAEVIANELKLSLYRIDLSAVVSKYIGETEKNLRHLFDAAEDGGAILFFDEADALFGKRSEVKDSHDRYANIEINYLLQRMEAYRGLAILATNMKAALDQAFMRRLRFIVNFPFPGPKERLLIWQKVFPPETPLADLDFERLARLNLTGGAISNIALNAAFMAAQQGGLVTMPLVLAAARTEFYKLERPIDEANFRWQGPA